MNDSPDKPQSPWSPPPPPKPTPGKGVYRPSLDARQWAWLALILVATGAGVWAMTLALPGRASFDGNWPQVAQWAMWGTIVAAAVVRLRLRPREAIRNILLWIVIAAALGFGYTVWMQLKIGSQAPPPARVVPRSLPGSPAQQVRLVVPGSAPLL